MKKLIIAFLIACIILIVGCKDSSVSDNPQNSQLVVEAFIYSGEKIENINLSKTLPLGSEDTTGTPLSDAQITISKNGIGYKLTPNTALPGNYIYGGNDLTVEPGNVFSIEITYQGNKTTAITTVPQKPVNVNISAPTLLIAPFTGGFGPGGPMAGDTTSIKVTWDNPDSSLYYVVIENLEAATTTIDSGRFMRERRMTFPPSATKEFVIARRNLSYYGKHKAIVYKVNQEYADLYESRNQDSRNLNEPLTNIKNGLGIFSAFSSQEVYFTVVSQ